MAEKGCFLFFFSLLQILALSSTNVVLLPLVSANEIPHLDPVTTEVRSNETTGYGTDISWPMHHNWVSTNYPWLPHNLDHDNYPVPEKYKTMPLQPLGDRQKVYEEFINGCQVHSGDNYAHLCVANEQLRIKRNMEQPSRMTNYTTVGFKKIRAPEAFFQLIKDFWETNKHLEKEEDWEKGYTITNHWVSIPTMVSVEDFNLVGGGFDFRDKIWGMANNIIQEWTGQLSFPTAVYGIRVYKEGSILTPHVDGLPRVSSMIVNVDQDVDEDWPLEVIGHDGKAYNVTMEPGEIVLYESHSIIHGRPFALRGKFFANIFIHFAPIDAFDAGVAIPEDDLSGLFTSNNAHDAALYGNLLLLKRIAQKKRSLLFKADQNGWLPIHEAARNGSFEIIWYLVQLGADINAVTDGHHTVLDVLIEYHGEHLPIVQKLRDLGAAASHHGHAGAPMDVSDGKKAYEHDEL